MSDDGVTYDPQTIASVDSWKISRKSNRQEVTAFEDKNKVYVQDLPDLTGSLTGFWDDSETTPWKAATSPTGCYMYLYPDVTNAPTKYAYGPAWLDCDIDVSVGGPVKFTGTFAANGDWVFNL